VLRRLPRSACYELHRRGLRGTKAQNFLKIADLMDAYSASLVFSAPERRYALAPDWLRRHPVPTRFLDGRPTGSPAAFLAQMLTNDLTNWLPEELLMKADKMTMAHSLELRVPFLDHEMVEYARALPAEWLIRGGVPKALLKAAALRVFPADFVNRPKQGFPVPMTLWLRGEMGDRARDLLLEQPRPYFRPQEVETLLRRHQAGHADLSQHLFTLLSFELWHRTIVDGEAPAARHDLPDGALVQ
jgi:Asparagine synthase